LSNRLKPQTGKGCCWLPHLFLQAFSTVRCGFGEAALQNIFKVAVVFSIETACEGERPRNGVTKHFIAVLAKSACGAATFSTCATIDGASNQRQRSCVL
jgi:hypothetical protein